VKNRRLFLLALASGMLMAPDALARKRKRKRRARAGTPQVHALQHYISTANQEADGAVAALREAIERKEVTLLLDVRFPDIAHRLDELKLVRIPEETEYYRCDQFTDDIGPYVRHEMKWALDELGKAFIAAQETLPEGILGIRPIITSATRSRSLSDIAISGHACGLGIDISAYRIDVRTEDGWRNNQTNTPVLLNTHFIPTLGETLMMMQRAGHVVATRELRPPHVHVTVIPTRPAQMVNISAPGTP
jgi:Family of unknown function (DUF5715)